jgi:citrate synthase
MGFGHRVYRAEDPRARVLRRTARELGAPALRGRRGARAGRARAELRERRPDRVLETNVEFWAAIVLDFAEVPAHMFTSMFTCARLAGWSAHILEQKKTGRLVRPSARYVGPAPAAPSRCPAGTPLASPPRLHLLPPPRRMGAGPGVSASEPPAVTLTRLMGYPPRPGGPP